MSKKNLLHVLLLISLIVLPACGKEPDFGYGPTATYAVKTLAPAEPTQQTAKSPIPDTPSPTPWPFKPESLGIRLDFYSEQSDGSLNYWVYVMNPNPGQVTDCVVTVILFDSNNEQLIDNQESCSSIEAFSEEWLIVEFDESFIPENYQAYNIFAQAAAPGGMLLEGELYDSPVIGQEGVDLSQSRVLPMFAIEMDWNQPPEDYLPGDEIEVQLIAHLLQGQLDESLLCIKVEESRDSSTEQTSLVTLAESCQTVFWISGETQYLDLKFLPSGYTWIWQEDAQGDFIPLEISARGEVLLQGVSLAEMDKSLYLPPVVIENASWSADGSQVDGVQPETPYLVDLKMRSLADDSRTHSLQISIRYTEHDPEEWVISSLFLFIPCLFGFCEDEAVVFTQEDQITLKEGAEYLYSIPVQLPQGPTGEEGIGGYYFLAVTFDGITIWRGEKVPLETNH